MTKLYKKWSVEICHKILIGTYLWIRIIYIYVRGNDLMMLKTKFQTRPRKMLLLVVQTCSYLRRYVPNLHSTNYTVCQAFSILVSRKTWHESQRLLSLRQGFCKYMEDFFALRDIFFYALVNSVTQSDRNS